MARSYSLSSEQAIAGSNAGFQRITTSGAYTGVFTKAKAIKASTGAEGVEFTFKADTGAEASYLSLYTHNKSGGETYGYSQLNALMACLKQRQIKPQTIQLKEWDNQNRQEKTVSVEAYPQLMNQSVGVVLQRQEYKKDDGSVGESMSLHGFFEPSTRQTGAEVIQQLPATVLDDVLANLRDKTISQQPSNQSVNARPDGMPATASETLSQAAKDFDDDIPF